MLQQTSVSRVLGTWQRFLDRFPTPTACANSPQSDVLREWSGLGFPRRARNLHRAAITMRDSFHGAVPETVHELLLLPGVGNYTSHAVASFAFAAPVGVLDTNSGRVLARCVAGRRLTPREAQNLMNDLVDPQKSGQFNQAVLDLGAQFCRSVPRCDQCPLRSKCVWRAQGGEDPAQHSAGVSQKQPSFVGSDRQIRGILLRRLARGPASPVALKAEARIADSARVERLLGDLEHEHLICRRGRRLQLADC